MEQLHTVLVLVVELGNHVTHPLYVAHVEVEPTAARLWTNVHRIACLRHSPAVRLHFRAYLIASGTVCTRARQRYSANASNC